MKSLLALTLCLLSGSVAFAQLPDCTAIPGWVQDGPLRAYEPDNLFDYMDGNAEGYLLYHFVGMKGISCKCGEDQIVIDISEMQNPEFAYGMFLANRDPRQPTERFGMAGQVLPRKASLVKDKYYVELAASPDKDHSPALRSLAELIEKSISGRTELPEAVGSFPQERLVPDSIRMVPESVLGLRALSSGYVAQYDFGKAFLVKEDSPETAAQTLAKLRERLQEVTPVPVGDEGFAGTDKYLDGLVVFRKGNQVAGFANLKAGTDVKAEATAFAERLMP